jgi:hypothetical protein
MNFCSIKVILPTWSILPIFDSHFFGEFRWVGRYRRSFHAISWNPSIQVWRCTGLKSFHVAFFIRLWICFNEHGIEEVGVNIVVVSL